LNDEVGSERSIPVVCSAFRGRKDGYGNLTVKKIPKAVLSRREWGKRLQFEGGEFAEGAATKRADGFGIDRGRLTDKGAKEDEKSRPPTYEGGKSVDRVLSKGA
jgi:hypothetical protein